MRVIVTGGSGLLGHFVLAHLKSRGYDPVSLDIAPIRHDDVEAHTVDLTDYAAVFDAVAGAAAVVHLAANPEPDVDHLGAADRFDHNTVTTFNVFNAAVANGIDRIVWASSETVLGYPFDRVRPDVFPVDDEHRLLPQNGYAISKVACEEIARHMHVRYGATFVGLRFSNVLSPVATDRANYAEIETYWDDFNTRKFNLWGYIDARDGAQSVRLGIESNITGAETFIIAAADTIMRQPSRELVDAVFPGTPVADSLGEFQSLLSTEKASRLLGYTPEHSWRDLPRHAGH